MSVDDVKKIKSAYEKMFEDGSAYKKINMPMVLNDPSSNPEAAAKPLGESVKTSSVEKEPEEDFSDIDRRMQERLKSRINSLKGKTSGQDSDLIKEINSLKKRIKTLEEALSLVMETQEKLLGE